MMTTKKSPKKILIAEDDTAQRLLLKMALETVGFQVIDSVDGVDAMQQFNANSEIRYVITDLQMPGLNGLDLIKEIRKIERRYTYIIVLTSIDEKDSVNAALKMGADDYIIKPVSQDELNLRIGAGERLLRLESQEELILSMAKLTEYRSQETGFHLERVKLYTNVLALDMQEHHPEVAISAAIAAEIARVSPLHDIGKISVPDRILNKPGKLTDDEFAQMEQHSIIGGNILMDLFEKTEESYLLVASQVAMYHHEKWDGSGYPKGLQGDNIPVAARIVALADVYDAISSKRCYKDPLDHAMVKDIILKGKGKHFDPRIVEAFLRHEDIWLTIRKRYADNE